MCIRDSTSVFRKSTFTGLTTKFYSFIPHIFKINLIKTLFDRGYKISSSYVNFTKELDFLKTLFLKNGFPEFIIDSTFRKLLSAKFKDKSQAKFTAPKDILYMRLHFWGKSVAKFDVKLMWF